MLVLPRWLKRWIDPFTKTPQRIVAEAGERPPVSVERNRSCIGPMLCGAHPRSVSNCPGWEQDRNGRCVHCQHAKACHLEIVKSGPEVHSRRSFLFLGAAAAATAIVAPTFGQVMEIANPELYYMKAPAHLFYFANSAILQPRMNVRIVDIRDPLLEGPEEPETFASLERDLINPFTGRP